MDAFTNAVADFGRRLGMRNLAPPESGAADFHFGALGALRLEDETLWALVTLSRPLPPDAERVPAQLLAACGKENARRWYIHPAMTGDGAMRVSARVPLEDFTAPAIEEAIELLSEILDGME